MIGCSVIFTVVFHPSPRKQKKKREAHHTQTGPTLTEIPAAARGLIDGHIRSTLAQKHQPLPLRKYNV